METVETLFTEADEAENSAAKPATTKYMLPSRYGFIRILGQGGFGKVLHVLDTDEEEEIAVKVIKKSRMGKTAIAALRQEAEILSSLNHDNVIRFKHVIETESRLYIGMELLRGGSLRTLIDSRVKAGKKFTDEEASTIMKGLLDAVKYLHHADIVHRDIKPDNLLLGNVDDLSSIKIADFGLSSRFLQESYLGGLSKHCGTVLYMAPELAQHRVYSRPIDIWSCGIILYILLVGRHPIYRKGDSDTKFFKRLSNPSIPYPDHVSFLASNLCSNLCKTNPVERYTIEQACDHPWVTRRRDAEIPLTVSETLDKFRNEEQFKRVIQKLVLVNLCAKRIQKVKLHPKYDEMLDKVSEVKKTNFDQMLAGRRETKVEEIVPFDVEMKRRKKRQRSFKLKEYKMLTSKSTKALLQTVDTQEKFRATSAHRHLGGGKSSSTAAYQNEYEVKPSEKILMIPSNRSKYNSEFHHQRPKLSEPKWSRKQSLVNLHEVDFSSSTTASSSRQGSRYPLSRTPDYSSTETANQENNNPFGVLMTSPTRHGPQLSLVEDSLKLPDISSSIIRTSTSPRASGAISSSRTSPRETTHWFNGSQMVTPFDASGFSSTNYSAAPRPLRSATRKNSNIETEIATGAKHRFDRFHRSSTGIKSSGMTQSTTMLKYRRLGKNSHAFGRPPTDRRARESVSKDETVPNELGRWKQQRINSGNRKRNQGHRRVPSQVTLGASQLSIIRRLA